MRECDKLGKGMISVLLLPRSVNLFALLLLASVSAGAQGIASGNLSPAARRAPSGRPFPVKFVDIAREAGIIGKITQGHAGPKKYILEANGTGLAFLDYDNDGWLDLFVVNGTRFEVSAKAPPPTSYLYRNQNATFTDVSRKAGFTRSGWGNGVCTGDFDNDGDTDLYVTYWGPNSLYRNSGKGTFEDVAGRAGVAGDPKLWSTGCTFADYDRDGLLDIFVARYVEFNPKQIPLPGAMPHCVFKDAPVFCGPRGLPASPPSLYRNKGDGTFEDVSARSGIQNGSSCYGFTATAADLNGDGWVDFYVACDSTASLYFRNKGDGTFSDVAIQAGIAYNEHGSEQAGMGLAVGDYNRDGWLDLTKTNFIRDYPNLYRNTGKGVFEDSVMAAGMAVNPGFVLWGTGFADFDNDGWVDVLQVAGHVYPEIQTIDASEPYRNPRLVYRNLGDGKFEDVSAMSGPAVSAAHSSRGAAFADFDNDGDVDVAIMNMDEAPSLARNDYTGTNRWIKVTLEGTKSNRSAIGANVTVVIGEIRQTAPVTSQTSYLSANDPRLHFGIGEALSVDRIVVRWPSGEAEAFPGAPAGSLVRLLEGSGKTEQVALKTK
jgi:hypothetical protein